MGIEAILFDLGHVIVDFEMNDCVGTMTSRCALGREEFEKVLWDTGWIRRYERGELSTRDFHAFLCREAGLRMDYEEFHHCWSDVFAPELIVPERLLARLRDGYPLVLISNTNEAHAEHIRRNYRVFDFFEHRIFSYEVGSLKPDHKIFECAIRAAGRRPESLLFIDDRAENIAAGRELGMRTHLFESLTGLERALQKAGVEVGDLAHFDTDSL